MPLLIALTFLTMLPLPLRRAPTPREQGAAVVCCQAVARLAMSAAVVPLPTARGTQGLGGSVKQYAGPWMLAVAAVIPLVPAGIVLRWDALALVAGALVGGAAPAFLALR